MHPFTCGFLDGVEQQDPSTTESGKASAVAVEEAAVEERAAAATESAEKAAANAGADIYLYNGPIRDEGFVKVLDAVGKNKVSDTAILLITTYGGDAHAAYRIARWFQAYYENFILFPTGVCASAGTLLAIGATKLYMSPFSELGPLDVQLFKRNELGKRTSGLVTKAALERLQAAAFEFWDHLMLHIKVRSHGNVSFEKCAEIASSVCGRAFTQVYRQIDLDILGEDYRDMQVAQEYGKRLAARGLNIDEASIERLVNDYPSHDFVIDFDEAADLFDDVELPPSDILKVMVALGHRAVFTQAEASSLIVERLATAPKVKTRVESVSNEIPSEGKPDVAESAQYETSKAS